MTTLKKYLSRYRSALDHPMSTFRPAYMAHLLNLLSTASFFLIAFLSQVLPSKCLPTTIPSPYVTQLSNGVVQVQEPLPSTFGTNTVPYALLSQPNTWTSTSGSPTAKSTTGVQGILPLTVSDNGPKTDGDHDPKPTLSKSRLTTGTVIARNSVASGVSASPGSVLSQSRAPPISELRDSSSSSMVVTTTNPSHIQSMPLSTTGTQNSRLSDLGSTNGGSSESTTVDGVSTSKDENQGAPSLLNDPLVSTSSTGAYDLIAQTKQPNTVTQPTTSPAVSPKQSPSPDSFHIGFVSSITTSTTKETKKGLLPTGGGPSLDGPANPNAPISFSTTSNAALPQVPASPLSMPDPQRTPISQETFPTLNESMIGVPTATSTTAPQDIKLEVVTNPVWTTDTLITTTLSGSSEPTVVPVFANCDGCGTGGSLVVSGSFKLGISYNLPKVPGFPSIPRFHLPCIAFCPNRAGPPPGGAPPQPGPPKREDKNGNDIEGGKNKDDKGDDKNGDTSNDKSKDRNDDSNDDNNDDKSKSQADDKGNDQTNTTQDDEQNDDQEDDEKDEEEDDEEDEDDEEQSTSSRTAEATSTTSPSPSSIVPSSTVSSTSTSSSTGISFITDTAYIDVRPTNIVVQDPDMVQYLRIAYSRLGIADGQSDSVPIPTSTGMPLDLFPSLSVLQSLGSSQLSSASSSSIASTSLSSDSPPAPTPSEPFDVEKINHGEVADPLVCHGVGGDIWMIHRDQAVSAAEQFCDQDVWEKEYAKSSSF